MQIHTPPQQVRFGQLYRLSQATDQRLDKLWDQFGRGRYLDELRNLTGNPIFNAWKQNRYEQGAAQYDLENGDVLIVTDGWHGPSDKTYLGRTLALMKQRIGKSGWTDKLMFRFLEQYLQDSEQKERVEVIG